MDKTSYITVGKIGRTYGVSGWLRIHTFTEFGGDLLKYSPWYMSQDAVPRECAGSSYKNDWKEVKIEDGRMQNNALLVKFAGIETPEEAKKLVGKLIAVQRSQLPKLKKDEYYWSDLVGLTVIDKDQQVLGKVIYLLETGSNDVLVVKGQREHAIPFLLGSVILKVDLEKKEIHVDWEPL